MSVSLVVTPTVETIARLKAMLESSVLVLDYETMMIQIAQMRADIPVGEDSPWVPRPSIVYDDVKAMDVVLNTVPRGNHVEHSLVVRAYSPKLHTRALTLGGNAPDIFVWILKGDLPPGRSTRLAVNNLTDTLVYREDPMSFSNEMLFSGD